MSEAMQSTLAYVALLAAETNEAKVCAALSASSPLAPAIIRRRAPGPLLVDLCFAWVVGIARRGMGGLVTPRRLEPRGAAGSRGMYEAHFGCPAKFDARENTIVFGKADLDRPFLTHNPDLFATVAPQLEAELAQALASEAIGDQVKSTLKRLLAGRLPGIEDVRRSSSTRPPTSWGTRTPIPSSARSTTGRGALPANGARDTPDRCMRGAARRRCEPHRGGGSL